MISGLVAPGALGLEACCGGRLVYSTLSTSAISLNFICHIMSSTALSTSSQRPSAPGPPGAGLVAVAAGPRPPTLAGAAAEGPGAGWATSGTNVQSNPINVFMYVSLL